MSRTTFNRIGIALILAAVLSLAPTASWASGPRHAQPPAAPARPVAAIASLLSEGWHHLASLWARAGSVIDPNGTWSPTQNTNSGTSSTSTDTDPRSLN